MPAHFDYPRSLSKNGIAYYHHANDNNSPVILLIHGVGLSADSWRYQIPTLEKHHTVYALDIAGHGASQSLFAMNLPANLDGYITSINDFIASTIRQPFIIIGHSLGALFAIHLAATHQNDQNKKSNSCRAVIALNAVYQRSPAAQEAVQERLKKLQASNNDSTAATAATEATLVRWFDDGNESDAATLCRRWLAQTMQHNRRGYTDAYAVFANENNITPQLLKSFTIPALFITGEDDNNSTPAMSQAMAAHTPSGKAEIIPTARHLAMLTHPDTINKASHHFINTAAV